MSDGGRIEAASAAEKNRTLEHAHIRFGIKTVTALRALGRDEAEGLPGTQGRRRNADPARHFADARFEQFRLSCCHGVLCFALMTLLAAWVAGAQSTGGRIRGTVTDPSGSAVP